MRLIGARLVRKNGQQERKNPYGRAFEKLLFLKRALITL